MTHKLRWKHFLLTLEVDVFSSLPSLFQCRLQICSMSQQCHLWISPRSWHSDEALRYLASRKTFGAIQKPQRKRSYSSEALLIGCGGLRGRPNYKKEKMSLPSSGSGDGGSMTMRAYHWLLCSHHWLGFFEVCNLIDLQAAAFSIWYC